MKTLFIIPARGGSKGIPGKNIKEFNGRPLIYYTVDVANKIADIKDICISTDDEQIRKKVLDFGINLEYIRPHELALDISGMAEVLLDGLDYYETKNGTKYDNIVLLQPTSPFRKVQHVNEAIEMFNLDIDMVVSVSESGANPYYTLFEEDKNGFLEASKKGNFVRRQDCPKVWELNGCVYVINCNSLKLKRSLKFNKIVKYEMDEIYSMDLDTTKDWKIAEIFFKENVDLFK